MRRSNHGNLRGAAPSKGAVVQNRIAILGDALLIFMRRQAALFQIRQRRGDWNALLLVMFALLAVAPSVLCAAPLRDAASQPQAVWQWLQSPDGATTRDLIARSLDLEQFPHLPPSEWATILSALQRAPYLTPGAHIEVPQRATHKPVSQDSSPFSPADLRAGTFFSLDSRRIAARALSPHEAAFRSGTRTNAWLE